MLREGINGIEELVTQYIRVRTAEDRVKALRDAFASENMRSQLVKYLNERPDLNVCATLTKNVIGSLIERNCKEDAFYERLVAFIFESDLLSGSDEESIVAFGVSLLDLRLPYRHYVVTSMDNETFTRVSETYLDEIGEIRRIARRPFLQKTEEASAILELIEGLEDHDARCVLLSHYLDELRSTYDGSAGK